MLDQRKTPSKKKRKKKRKNKGTNPQNLFHPLISQPKDQPRPIPDQEDHTKPPTNQVVEWLDRNELPELKEPLNMFESLRILHTAFADMDTRTIRDKIGLLGLAGLQLAAKFKDSLRQDSSLASMESTPSRAVVTNKELLQQQKKNRESGGVSCSTPNPMDDVLGLKTASPSDVYTTPAPSLTRSRAEGKGNSCSRTKMGRLFSTLNHGRERKDSCKKLPTAKQKKKQKIPYKKLASICEVTLRQDSNLVSTESTPSGAVVTNKELLQQQKKNRESGGVSSSTPNPLDDVLSLKTASPSDVYRNNHFPPTSHPTVIIFDYLNPPPPAPPPLLVDSRIYADDGEACNAEAYWEDEDGWLDDTDFGDYG